MNFVSLQYLPMNNESFQPDQDVTGSSLPKPNGLGENPPRPTIADTPPPSPTGIQLPLSQPQSGQVDNSYRSVEDEPVFDVSSLGEDEARDLYQKAKNFFWLSFGSLIPLLGVLIGLFCWTRTRAWKNAGESQEIDDVSEMMSVAAKISQTWFVFSCVAAFICLTSVSFPTSLVLMSVVSLAAGVYFLVMVALIPVLVYRFLDLEIDRYKASLISVRAIAGCLCYTLVSHLIFYGILDLFGLPITLGITCFALYSVLGSYHRALSSGKVLLVSFLAWLAMLGVLMIFAWIFYK